MIWHPVVTGNNFLNSLGRLLLLSQTCPTVKQSWSKDCRVSLILPQPTTSDGDDCSLEINETTNLPDNIPSWGTVADAVGSLFIHPPESILETIASSVCELYAMIWCLNLHNYQMYEQHRHILLRKKHYMISGQSVSVLLMESLSNSELAGFDVCTFCSSVLRGNTQEHLHMMTLLHFCSFGFVRSCPPEKHPWISKWTDLTI